MDEFGLGPNGAMLYCMEYLEENFDWLVDQLAKLDGAYFIFDVAGQVRFRFPSLSPLHTYEADGFGIR